MAKVDPPNYDFSLDGLSSFFPNQKWNLEDFEKKFGKADLIKNSPPYQVYQYQVAQLRYKFPVLVQIKDGIITDFFARLPSYFLHDVFHQSLINRLGKQTQYKKINGHAFYTWEGFAGNESLNFYHSYAGTCAITCFPIFYAGISNTYRSDPSFKSIDQIIDAHAY